MATVSKTEGLLHAKACQKHTYLGMATCGLPPPLNHGATRCQSCVKFHGDFRFDGP